MFFLELLIACIRFVRDVKIESAVRLTFSHTDVYHDRAISDHGACQPERVGVVELGAAFLQLSLPGPLFSEALPCALFLYARHIAVAFFFFEQYPQRTAD